MTTFNLSLIDTFHNKLLFQFISRLAEKTKGIQQEEANRQRREEKQWENKEERLIDYPLNL